ncbi:MAG: hypothetical protein HY707_03015 [Ignavibacteriae bacterium]|nr:hypothetical protein [Ignavibacteriota bacterium]
MRNNNYQGKHPRRSSPPEEIKEIHFAWLRSPQSQKEIPQQTEGKAPPKEGSDPKSASEPRWNEDIRWQDDGGESG